MLHQTEMVLQHMMKYGPISGRIARDMYGIERLGARIWDLKQAGFDIRDGWVHGKNRFGVETHWKEYWLRRENNA